MRSFLNSAILSLLIATTAATQQEATRPRRVNASSAINTATAVASDDVKRAFALLQAGRFQAAEEIASRLTTENPADANGWKVVGFAKLGLKKYADAAGALERTRELQRGAGGQEDMHTARALAQSLVYAERFEQALPLLVNMTDETGEASKTFNAQTRAELFTLRGAAELRTGKAAAAETSFSRAVRLDAKNAPALFYLGRIAYDAGQLNKAIIMLNRATLTNARFGDAWHLLSIAYLRRAAEAETRTGDAASNNASAEADRLSAVRASASFMRADSSPAAAQLYAQALIAAKQYARAAELLEIYATKNAASLDPTALYLLGVAHSRTKNYAAAIKRLEQAAERAADDASIQTELGYAYEITKQYAKALAAYERAAQLSPDDMSLTESIARVRPFAR